MNGVTLAVAGLLAQNEPPRDTGPDFGKASPFGLLVVVLLLIGTVLLVWSMNRHLRKLPKSFDRDNPETDRVTGEGTVVDPESTTDAPGDSTTREPGG